jgi:S-disulfanyl-L-cysteine oxidoreductase SoxD
MRCSVSLLTTAIAFSAWVTALAQGPTYQMGRAPTDAEIKALFPILSADGRGLPQGSGSPREGAALFAQKCAVCHGPDGKGGVIRGVIPLGNAKPVKLPYSLVPYATTVWDFINRAMPQNNPGTLTPNEVYALTAYVLSRNDVIKETDVLDAKTLPAVRMPNRDNMVPAQPEWKAGEKRQFGNYP